MLADATYFSGKVVQGDADEIEVEVKDSSREDKKGTRTRIRTGAISHHQLHREQRRETSPLQPWGEPWPAC